MSTAFDLTNDADWRGVRPSHATLSIVPPRASHEGEGLGELLVPPLARAIEEIAAAARAPDVLPGASSFCILDARLADGATYLQYLADPGQDELLWEVASGAWSVHQHALSPEEATRLGALGFIMRGAPGNARHGARVRTAADAADVARRSVAILVEVLGFDGRGPVTLQVTHEAPAGRAVRRSTPRPTEVAALLHQAGDPTAESWRGSVRAHAHGHPFEVRADGLGHLVTAAGPYERLCFAASWPRVLPAATVARLERDFRGCRVRNEPDGRLSLHMDVLLRMGAPVAQLAAWLDEWRRAVGIVAHGGEAKTVS